MVNPELLAYLIDKGSPLAGELQTWLESKRWEAFATVHRDKIRKKLRETRDPAAVEDLRAELATAYLLLREPHLSVVYEPLGRSNGPAPDYSVSFTTSLTLMLEVTRLRDFERLGEVVAAKLRQLSPANPNVLLVWLADVPPAPGAAIDLAAAMQRLKQRAEGGEQLLLGRGRFATRADFFAHLGRLNELLVRPPDGSPSALAAWSNPIARRPLPQRVRSALLRGMSGMDDAEGDKVTG